MPQIAIGEQEVLNYNAGLPITPFLKSKHAPFMEITILHDFDNMKTTFIDIKIYIY
jgi:hypothetical protein